jgi:GTP-binding protein
VPFVDSADIHVEGGRGGNGCLSFRREAHVPKGGPDGGNGGRGGTVLLEVDPRVRDLGRFRHDVHHRAGRGGHGEGRNRHGRSGEDLVIGVPAGTRVMRDGAEIAFLEEPGERIQVARGGDGGAGNRTFRSSTRQTPRETTPGGDGESAWLSLELRLPVAVAIVGLPNSGKSAVLNALTGARAEVAPYPWSTREPSFGPLRDDEERIHTVVDLPGLSEDGSHRPDSRLGQLERVRVVVHCVDAADPEPIADRLARARAGLAGLVPEDAREIVVATACDPAECPPEADRAVETETGAGVDALRAAILEALAR